MLFYGDNLIWTFYSDGLLKITGSGTMKDYRSGGGTPFNAYRERINRVILPDGITAIGDYAFQGGYPNLPYIEIPLSVRYIQDCSFGVGYDNVKLKYPGTIEQWKSITIADYFYDCYYGAECTDGTILYMGRCGTDASFDVMGDGTRKITGTGTMSFYKYLQQASYWDGDDAIKRVEIAEGITNIAAYAFKNCTNLQSIVIPASVKTIGCDVFYNCNALTDVYYASNERAWDAMIIAEKNNDPLFRATIHYTDLCAEGHDIQTHEAKAPTCEEIGWNAYENCSRCYYTSYVEIPATGHDHQAVVTPPTCEENGYTTYTCSRCGDTYTADEVAALEHAYSAWQYNASSKTHTRVCRHDATHTETKNCSFDAGVVVTEPAVGKAGTKKFTCTVCGGSYTESIPALEEEGVQRIFGSTRYETSIEIANQLKKRMGVSKFNAIVVASGVDFADALSGAYLANQKGAPILLTSNSKSAASVSYTTAKGIHSGLVIGGTTLISDSVVAKTFG